MSLYRRIDKNRKYGNEWKYGIRKCRKKKKYTEGKVKGYKTKYAGGETSSGHAQEDFGRKSAGQDNWEAWGIEGSAGGKGSTGMLSETVPRHKQKKKKRGNRKGRKSSGEMKDS